MKTMRRMHGGFSHRSNQRAVIWAILLLASVAPVPQAQVSQSATSYFNRGILSTQSLARQLEQDMPWAGRIPPLHMSNL